MYKPRYWSEISGSTESDWNSRDSESLKHDQGWNSWDWEKSPYNSRCHADGRGQAQSSEWEESSYHTRGHAYGTAQAQTSMETAMFAALPQASDKRLARDGKTYTLQEFIVYYGVEQGAHRWQCSGFYSQFVLRANSTEPMIAPERRIANDGQTYTLGEFILHYGLEQGLQKWYGVQPGSEQRIRRDKSSSSAMREFSGHDGVEQRVHQSSSSELESQDPDIALAVLLFEILSRRGPSLLGYNNSYCTL